LRDEEDERKRDNEEPKRTKEERHVDKSVKPSWMKTMFSKIGRIEIVNETVPCCDVDGGRR